MPHWNRAEADLDMATSAEQPEANVELVSHDQPSGATRQTLDDDPAPVPAEVVDLESPPAKANPKPTKSAATAPPKKQQPAEFLDGMQASNELTAQEQQAVAELMKKSPEAARFLAGRAGDPTEKNLALVHDASLAPPPEGDSAGVDLLRAGRTMPPPPLKSGKPAATSANAYPPNARLGAPGPLEAPVEPRQQATAAPAAQQQLPVVEYGNQAGAPRSMGPQYDRRLPPPEQLRPSRQQLEEAYRGGSATSPHDPRQYRPPTTNPYVNQAPPAGANNTGPNNTGPNYAAPPAGGGPRQGQDPRVIVNQHVQQSRPVQEPVAPASYNASYPQTAAGEYPAVDAPGEIEPEKETDPQPLNWREELEAAIAALENQINATETAGETRDETSATDSEPYQPTPLEEQQIAQLDAQLRMLYLAGGMREAAVAPVEHYDTNQQEFWKYAMNGLSVYLDRDKHPVEDRRLRLALRDLRHAVTQLASSSSLDVQSLAFCSKVDSFGSYEEFPEYQFSAGEEVLLYVEVENFTSEKISVGYETSLLGSYRVFDDQKSRVADHTFIEETETCRNQRRDYFITYRMWIPKEIDPGRYTLQLTLEDLKGNKSGQASLRFEVE